jgi:hypothetical protein
MVLRGADYPRQAEENYRTPPAPVRALIPHLTNIRTVLIPSDRGRDSVLARSYAHTASRR